MYYETTNYSGFGNADVVTANINALGDYVGGVTTVYVEVIYNLIDVD